MVILNCKRRDIKENSIICLSSGRTIKDSKAVLSGGRQRLAGGVQLVAIVPNADLELDGFTWLLEHARAVKHGAQRVLPPPLVFLREEKGACSMFQWSSSENSEMLVRGRSCAQLVPVPPGCHHWRCHQHSARPSHPAAWTAPPGSSPCRPRLHPESDQKVKIVTWKFSLAFHFRSISTKLVGLSNLSKVKFLIGVRKATEFSGTAVQVDITGAKGWEEANF